MARSETSDAADEPDRLVEATASLKQLAVENGADVVGVASVDAIDERAPEGHRIRDLWDGAETAIVTGTDETTDGTKATKSSEMLWLSKLHRRGVRASITMSLADAIEDYYGYKAFTVPLTSNAIAMEPTISMKVAAEEAGLGRRGINDLVLNPELGAYANYLVVATDMPLVTDEPLEENPCPTRFCKNAYTNSGITPCIAACPVDALDGDLDEDGEIEARTFDRTACMSHAMEFGPARFVKMLEEVVAEEDEERRRMKIKGRDFQRMAANTIRGTGWASCWECQKVCPVGHEGAQELIADGGVDAENPGVEDVLKVRAMLTDEYEFSPEDIERYEGRDD